MYGAILKKIITTVTLTATIFVSACSGSRIVQPLNQGQWQAAVSAGGPIIKNNDYALPLGLSSASVAYGLSQSATGFAGIGISSEAQDLHHIDAGFTYELITPFEYQPGITITPQLNIFRDKSGLDTRLYRQFDINTYWLSPFRHDFYYVGMSNWFELNTKKTHQLKQTNHWIPSLHTGYTFQGKKYGLNLEVKFIAPNKNNQNQLIDYVGIKNQGVWGGYMSISRKFR